MATAGDVAIATLFGSMFSTLALVDFSVDKHYAAAVASGGDSSFGQLYYAYKHKAPVIGPILLILLLLLPVSLWAGVKDDLLPLLRGQAKNVKACVIGVISLCLTLFLIGFNMGLTKKAEDAFIAAKGAEAAAASFEEMSLLHSISLALNVATIFIPMQKYNALTGAGAGAAVAPAASTASSKKEDKKEAGSKKSN